MKKPFSLTVACLLYILYASAQTKIPIDEAAKHIGETVRICERVYGGKFLENAKTQPTLLNMGGAYPRHKLTIFISREDRKNFAGKPEDIYANKNVCVTGKLTDYKGKPEIIVSKPEEITIDETHQGIEKIEPQ